jgi:anti-sigma factor (TIGR02949 family)
MTHPHKDPETDQMECRELFARLSEYVDGELSQELCEHIRQHLADCAPCVNFAHTLKTTAELCRRLPSRPIPPEVAAELRAFLSSQRQAI